jgi:arsenate reductase
VLGFRYWVLGVVEIKIELMIKIYHNPRCSKSREGLGLLEEQGAEVEVIHYLKTPPTQEELMEIIRKLDIQPLDLIRKNEKIFKEKYRGKTLSDNDWIAAMVANPILIERPIVFNETKAIIGRPPSLVLTILN